MGNGLRVCVLGDTGAAGLRRASLRRLGVPQTDAARADAVFVALPPAERQAVAAAHARQGQAVFVEWPPAPALRDVQALVALAQEAGVAVGVARTLRFHAAVQGVARPARLVVLRRTRPAGASLLAGHTLADLADLCLFLAEGPALTRVDAQAVRSRLRAPRALAFHLRFQNGAYAQAALLPARAETFSLHATGATHCHDAELGRPADWDAARDAETRAFLDALSAARPAPTTPLDALQTLRLVESLWTRLR